MGKMSKVKLNYLWTFFKEIKRISHFIEAKLKKAF